MENGTINFHFSESLVVQGQGTGAYVFRFTSFPFFFSFLNGRFVLRPGTLLTESIFQRTLLRLLIETVPGVERRAFVIIQWFNKLFHILDWIRTRSTSTHITQVDLIRIGLGLSIVISYVPSLGDVLMGPYSKSKYFLLFFGTVSGFFDLQHLTMPREKQSIISISHGNIEKSKKKWVNLISAVCICWFFPMFKNKA